MIVSTEQGPVKKSGTVSPRKKHRMATSLNMASPQYSKFFCFFLFLWTLPPNQRKIIHDSKSFIMVRNAVCQKKTNKPSKNVTRHSQDKPYKNCTHIHTFRIKHHVALLIAYKRSQFYILIDNLTYLKIGCERVRKSHISWKSAQNKIA